jgi:hypothetical protein
MMSKFEKAFAAARKSGKKEFSFGGKSYNTKLKADAPTATKSQTSKNIPVPKDRPAVAVPKDKPSRTYATTPKEKSRFPDSASKPVQLKEAWTPEEFSMNKNEFSSKVDAARDRKESKIKSAATAIGKDAASKSTPPAPPSKAIVDQYGLGKKK